MSSRSLTTEQILTMLADAPERIAAITADLTPAQLRTHPGPNEWSAVDVLAHLRSCADVWGGSIATIISEDGSTIRAINPRTWIKRTDYRDLEFQPSLHAFTAQRIELVAVLQRLPTESWSCSATVTGAGKTLQRTVLTYAAWLARHERSHFKQFARIAEAVRS